MALHVVDAVATTPAMVSMINVAIVDGSMTCATTWIEPARCAQVTMKATLHCASACS